MGKESPKEEEERMPGPQDSSVLCKCVVGGHWPRGRVGHEVRGKRPHRGKWGVPLLKMLTPANDTTGYHSGPWCCKTLSCNPYFSWTWNVPLFQLDSDILCSFQLWALTGVFPPVHLLAHIPSLSNSAWSRKTCVIPSLASHIFDLLFSTLCVQWTFSITTSTRNPGWKVPSGQEWSYAYLHPLRT